MKARFSIINRHNYQPIGRVEATAAKDFKCNPCSAQLIILAKVQLYVLHVGQVIEYSCLLGLGASVGVVCQDGTMIDWSQND